MPHLTPAVAAAILWQWLLHPEVGPVNYLLASIGLGKPGWFASPQWALPSIVMVSLWTYWGGNNMLIFLAGLQGVPRELYDAAEVDGAGAWTRFRHVTVPLISPTTFFILVTSFIGAMQGFDSFYVMTRGGPGDSSRTVVMIIYESAFQNLAIGYGAAIASLLFLLIMALTVLQFGLSTRWVHYG
jgi:multiple sugar transport system permease protein